MYKHLKLSDSRTKWRIILFFTILYTITLGVFVWIYPTQEPLVCDCTAEYQRGVSEPRKPTDEELLKWFFQTKHMSDVKKRICTKGKS